MSTSRILAPGRVGNGSPQPGALRALAAEWSGRVAECACREDGVEWKGGGMCF